MKFLILLISLFFVACALAGTGENSPGTQSGRFSEGSSRTAYFSCDTCSNVGDTESIYDDAHPWTDGRNIKGPPSGPFSEGSGGTEYFSCDTCSNLGDSDGAHSGTLSNDARRSPNGAKNAKGSQVADQVQTAGTKTEKPTRITLADLFANEREIGSGSVTLADLLVKAKKDGSETVPLADLVAQERKIGSKRITLADLLAEARKEELASKNHKSQSSDEFSANGPLDDFDSYEVSFIYDLLYPSGSERPEEAKKHNRRQILKASPNNI